MLNNYLSGLLFTHFITHSANIVFFFFYLLFYFIEYYIVHFTYTINVYCCSGITCRRPPIHIAFVYLITCKWVGMSCVYVCEWFLQSIILAYSQRWTIWDSDDGAYTASQQNRIQCSYVWTDMHICVVGKSQSVWESSQIILCCNTFAYACMLLGWVGLDEHNSLRWKDERESFVQAGCGL